MRIKKDVYCVYRDITYSTSYATHILYSKTYATHMHRIQICAYKNLNVTVI